MKIDAYGNVLEIIKENGEWAIYILGEGKKRRSFDIVIPSDLDEQNVILFLEDILHESATPENPRIKRVN